MRQFQYNKTEQLSLDRELKVRLGALPTLKNKESALRAEVGKIKVRLVETEKSLESELERIKGMDRLWCEFPDLVRVRQVRYKKKNIAGVKVDAVEEIEFDQEPIDFESSEAWFPFGVFLLKKLLELKVQIASQRKILSAVELARRKTTQKVNLYEKVQIPAYEDAIRRIKRFLEDEENISKSSQKILKRRFDILEWSVAGEPA